MNTEDMANHLPILHCAQVEPRNGCFEQPRIEDDVDQTIDGLAVLGVDRDLITQTMSSVAAG